MNYLIYLTSILFTVAFVMYTKYQFEDMKATWATAKRKWHPWGAFMRVMFFVGVITEHFFTSAWKDLFLAGVICVILWDILVNVVDLGVTWNYNGTTAKTDKIGKIKWFVYAGLLLTAIILKFTFK
jgi:hypothetical protein